MGIFSKVSSLFRKQDAQDIIDNLEDVLLEAGLSPKIAYEVIDALDKKTGATPNLQKVMNHLKEILKDLAKEYHFELPSSLHAYIFIGVNGVGKTTSIAKFIHYLLHEKKVAREEIVVAAGDTFRAGAIEQLHIHCNALGVHLIKQRSGSDPAAVIYDALYYAKSRNIKYVIVDTAGRMNNRKDLISQLQKIYRLLHKDLEPSQITSFIVLDGNSGLNTVSQVEDFSEAVALDAVILSKYDGSSKGGSLLSVAKAKQMPCAFLGTGEKYGDFKEFDKEEFLDDFLSP